MPTIRYYEQIGLIPPARRRPSGHRVYDTTAQDLLIFVRGCREYGFPIEQVRALVALTHSQGRDCVETRDIAQTHLDAVRVKLKELGALELSLAKFAWPSLLNHVREAWILRRTDHDPCRQATRCSSPPQAQAKACDESVERVSEAGP